MVVVKIQNKDLLDQIQAILTLKSGKKYTQKEILDLCIQLGFENVDTLLLRLIDSPKLTKEKIERIITRRDSRKNVPYIKNLDFLSEDDKDIYFS